MLLIIFIDYDNVKLTKIKKEGMNMTNLIYQGKINCQFWGKLIRHFFTSTHLQCVTWGGSLVVI